MKKQFQLLDEKKNPERVIEAIKHEIRKYIKRERSKKLAEGADFWDFDCRFGPNSDAMQPLHIAELTAALDKAYEERWEYCTVEIIAKPATRVVKPTQEVSVTSSKTEE